MKMKKCCKIILFILLFTVLFTHTMQLMERKAGDKQHEYFVNAKEDFDVLFLGSSHVEYGIYPMDLWDKYGIVSYNLGSNGCFMPVAYWNLVQALEIKKPKVVVIDTYNIKQYTCENEDATYNGYLQEFFDWMPISSLKWEAVCDITKNKKNRNYYFFNFSVYHNRWHELNSEDFDYEDKTNARGSSDWVGVAVPNEVSDFTKKEGLSNLTGDLEYLKKIIMLCEENEIEVLLTYLPFPANEESYREANTIGEIAKNYNVKYLNFLSCYEEAGIDFSTDCVDANSHLNSSGIKKVDAYLGSYLVNNFQLQDHRNDDSFKHWKEDFIQWHNSRAELLNQQKNNVKNYLMLMYDSNFSYYVHINENSMVWKDEVTINLLQQLFPEQDFSCVKEIECFQNNSSLSDEKFEQLTYQKDDSDKKYLQIGETKLDMESDIQIVVWDNFTGSCISAAD